MKSKFELVNGRIYLVVTQRIWAFDIDEEDSDIVEVLREDVTDKVMPKVDDYLDEQLGLKPEFKYNRGKIEYIGEEE